MYINMNDLYTKYDNIPIVNTKYEILNLQTILVADWLDWKPMKTSWQLLLYVLTAVLTSNEKLVITQYVIYVVNLMNLIDISSYLHLIPIIVYINVDESNRTPTNCAVLPILTL